eukprot:SAG22_NODE_62_length_23371_cov_84.500602_34_plen_537_part_00
MGDESLVEQMKKLQVGEARVGDVVRLSPDAKGSPIKMRDQNLFVRSVAKSGNITYSPKKTGGSKKDQSTTTPDRLLLVKKAPDKKSTVKKSTVKKSTEKKVTTKKKEFVPDPIHLEMQDEFGILPNDIIFTLEPTYDYMSAMMGSDVKEFFDPCPGDRRNGRDWDGLKMEWKSPAYCNPPFSKAFDWLDKAVDQAEKGVKVVMLVAADKVLFQQGLDRTAKFEDYKSRVHFECFSHTPDFQGANHKWMPWGNNMLTGEKCSASPFGTAIMLITSIGEPGMGKLRRESAGEPVDDSVDPRLVAQGLVLHVEASVRIGLPGLLILLGQGVPKVFFELLGRSSRRVLCRPTSVVSAEHQLPGGLTALSVLLRFGVVVEARPGRRGDGDPPFEVVLVHVELLGTGRQHPVAVLLDLGVHRLFGHTVLVVNVNQKVDHVVEPDLLEELLLGVAQIVRRNILPHLVLGDTCLSLLRFFSGRLDGVAFIVGPCLVEILPYSGLHRLGHRLGRFCCHRCIPCAHRINPASVRAPVRRGGERGIK